MIDPLLNNTSNYFIQLKELLQGIDSDNIGANDAELLDTLREHKSKLVNLINNFDLYKKDAQSTITHIDEILMNVPNSGGKRKTRKNRRTRRKNRK